MKANRKLTLKNGNDTPIMTTELKVIPPVVTINNANAKNTQVSIKHVVEFTIHSSFTRRKEWKSRLFRLHDAQHDVQARIIFISKVQGNDCSAYLQVVPSPNPYKLNGKVNFSFKRIDDEIKCTEEAVMSKEYSVVDCGWGIVIASFGTEMYNSNFQYRDWLAACTNLVIICEIHFPMKKNTPALEVTQTRPIQLTADLGQLFTSEELSDITFKVGEKELKAHKLILSARSPVFNRMFKSDMAETRQNMVEITDMDFEVLKSVLVYMYTDQVPNIETLAEEILAAAEKYQLKDLKEKCGDVLSKSLTVENAARLFILAELHQAEGLNDQAIQFIKGQKEEVMLTEGWKLAKEAHPKVIALFMNYW